MQLEGLIAYLVNRTDIRGKKAFQKLIYFCCEAGVPIYARYRMHIYGPYSDEVAEELGEAITKEIVKVAVNGSGFSRGFSCGDYLNRYMDEIELNRDKINRVLDAFGSYSPLELELNATVHFIASSLNQAYGKVPENRVVEEVKKAKGDKFSERQIRNAYSYLIEGGWLTLDV